MKKPVTEEKTFCDFCDQPGYTECMVCDKDLCPQHRIELVIYLDRQDWPFRASLCRECAQPLLPFLESLQEKSTTWRKAGHNPESNEKRLTDILFFLKTGAPIARPG